MFDHAEYLEARHDHTFSLEPLNGPAARYCRIRGLPIITVPELSAWTDQRFEMVVVACYVTAPDSRAWAAQVTSWSCRDAADHIARGAELVLFHLRWVEPFERWVEERGVPVGLHRDERGQQRCAIFKGVGHIGPTPSP